MSRPTSLGHAKAAVPLTEDLDAATLLPEVVRRLREDQRYKVDMKLLTEIRTYKVFTFGSTRAETSVPTSFLGRQDLSGLLHFFLSTQAYRERVNEVQIQTMTLHNQLNDLWDLCVAALHRDGSLKSVQPSKMKQHLRIHLGMLARRIDDAQLLISACELKLKELDGAYFSLKEIENIGIKVTDEQNGTRRLT